MASPGNEQEEVASHFRLITAAPRTRELTGAVDLLSYYGLKDHYEKFYQKPLATSIGESRYLKNVVGDIDIRKGEGMELGQLLGPDNEDMNIHIHQFDMDILQQAFTLRQSGSISLCEADRGIATISTNMKDEPKDKDRKHRKHKKHKDRHKDKDKDRQKERDKEKDKDKDKERSRDKDRGKKKENGEDNSKKHHKKKRKHDGDEEEGEAHKHKKKKHKHTSKADMPEQLVIR